MSSAYDSAIFNYFDEGRKTHLRVAEDVQRMLRYGENPTKGVCSTEIWKGVRQDSRERELSYNNLQDIDAGLSLIDEFVSPTFAILKHGNACGMLRETLSGDTRQAALAGDPVSAFGGILQAIRP